jgi:eukaryotic-like serine/threonine-protein kinase
VGILDKWLKSFMKEEAPPPDRPESAPRSAPSPGEDTAPSPEGEGERPPPRDPLEESIRRTRARLTADAIGRAFAEGPELQVEVKALDAGGRSKAADSILADALLVTPSKSLRRQLAERLLHRGDRAKARPLLEKLVDLSAPAGEHATFALTALGEIAEAEGDVEEALLRYEQVLALDISLVQPKARARRLRAGNDARRGDDGRRVLARFLGARAAGSRYAVVDEVGRGGAATVFRARDRVIGREVALKIFHARGAAADRRSRIVQEARIAGSFDHPHVVPILDLDEERDLLVMALCDGGSLQRRIASEKKLRHSEAVELGAVLLRTLADIHDAGHVHLDIKPSNLLLHEEQIMLCDFGTAGMREMGALAGTRAYMAPEHRATGSAGPPADLYMAGLVIAECIEGRVPAFGAAPALASMPAGPRRRALEATLAQLVEKAPADRPRDGRAAADLLLEAGALPLYDKEGAALYHHVESLAQREGEAAVARMRSHPLVGALLPPQGDAPAR